MGAQLWLTDKFNERPTRSEVNKKIDAVMAAQDDLVDIVHTLRQIICVKG